jgi:hypothetical protein
MATMSAMWMNAWKGWDASGVVLWILLSIGFGLLFRYTIGAFYDWLTKGRR